MKLKTVQWMWMVGTLLFMAAIVMDIANILDVPTAAIIVVAILLMIVSWAVGPSLADLKKADRRG